MIRLICLMWSGSPLTDDARDILLQTAGWMATEKELYTKVEGSGFRGHVETAYQHVSLGSHASGIQFTAELDVGKGTTKVAFLIPEKELHATARENQDGSYWIDDLRTSTAPERAWLN